MCLGDVEWQLSLQTAPSTKTKSGDALPREHGLERLEEYLDLAITIETRENGGEILNSQYDLWSLLWQENEPPELDDGIEGQNSGLEVIVALTRDLSIILEAIGEAEQGTEHLGVHAGIAAVDC